MLYLNVIVAAVPSVPFDLTLTSVVFEFSGHFEKYITGTYLTLTSVVFELVKK